MCFGDVIKNFVLFGLVIVSFLFIVCNDVIFFIFMKDNGMSLMRKNIKNNFKNLL